MMARFWYVALVLMLLLGCSHRQTFTVSGETRIETGNGQTQPVIVRASWTIDPVGAPSSKQP